MKFTAMTASVQSYSRIVIFNTMFIIYFDILYAFQFMPPTRFDNMKDSRNEFELLTIKEEKEEKENIDEDISL